MKFILVFFSLFLFVSCDNVGRFDAELESRSLSNSESSVTGNRNSEASNSKPDAKEDVSPSGIMLIKEGFLEFETGSMDSTSNAIQNKIKTFGGYISSEHESNSGYYLRTQMILKIPSRHFESFVSSFDGSVEHFDKKDIQVKDVSLLFKDYEVRLKTKLTLEDRYLALLKKATKIEDILRIEKQIQSLRYDIESINGRFKALQGKINYSTLTIDYYKTIKQDNSSVKEDNQFLNAFKGGWNLLSHFMVALVYLWPFLFLIGFGFGIYKYKTKNKNK